MDYALDYGDGGGYAIDGPGRMMSRVRDTLDHKVWTTDERDLHSSARSIGELRRMFSGDGGVSQDRERQRRHQQQVVQKHMQHFDELPKPGKTVRVVKTVNEENIPSYHPSKRKGWTRPQCDAPAPADPGWMPDILKSRSRGASPTPYQVESKTSTSYPGRDSINTPQRDQQFREYVTPKDLRDNVPPEQYPSEHRRRQNSASKADESGQRPTMTPFPDQRAKIQRQQAPAGHNYETEESRHADSSRPAWMGSLKSSGQTKAWEVMAGENIVPGGIDSYEPKPQSAAQSSTYQGGRDRHQREARQDHRQQHHGDLVPRQRPYTQPVQHDGYDQPQRKSQYMEYRDSQDTAESTNISQRPTASVSRRREGYGESPQQDTYNEYHPSQERHSKPRYNPEVKTEPTLGQTRRRQESESYYQDTETAPYNKDIERTRSMRQYNNPAGLYGSGVPQEKRPSQQAQTRSRTSSGSGIVISTGIDGKKYFNPSESNVYQLLKEEEEMRKQRARRHSARHKEHAPGHEMAYHGYTDPMQKSPTMIALQRYVD